MLTYADLHVTLTTTVLNSHLKVLAKRAVAGEVLAGEAAAN